MEIKYIIDEDFVNYKKPSMFIGFPYCTFKCGREHCQNAPLISEPNIIIDCDDIIKRYINNDLTSAIVIGGLEPFISYSDLLELIHTFRFKYNMLDDIVIYTGYDKSEIEGQIEELKLYPNIIVKFGRFIPGHNPHYDEILGVNLISDNQYAEVIN